MKMLPVKFFHHRAKIFGVLLVMLLCYFLIRSIWEFIAK